MKLILQRVKSANVKVDGKVISEIGPGILTLLGVAKGDNEEQLTKLITKACELRIFEDENGKMNRSIKDIQGEHLIVSQFTLLADCSQGRRPSFMNAELPEPAKQLYEKALELSSALGINTKGGIFQAHMEISLVNDGPVTMILESN